MGSEDQGFCKRHLYSWSAAADSSANLFEMLNASNGSPQFVMGVLAWHDKPAGNDALPGAFFLGYTEAKTLKGWEHVAEAVFIGQDRQIRLLRDKSVFRLAMIGECDKPQPPGPWKPEVAQEVTVVGKDRRVLLIREGDKRFSYAKKIGAFSGAFGLFDKGIGLVEYSVNGRSFDWRLTVPKVQEGSKPCRP